MRHGTVLDQEMFGEEITPEDLAEALGDLRYDSLAAYLARLAEKLRRDAEADLLRGRSNLADKLALAARDLEDAATNVGFAWGICRRYMDR